MSPVMTFRIALKALARNKMRTALTMLGMIIGVSAVITLVALGRGAQQRIEDQIKAGGTNLVTVTAGNATTGGVRGGAGVASNLTLDDVDAIKKDVAGVEYITPMVNSRAQVIAGNQNWQTRIQGTDVDLAAHPRVAGEIRRVFRHAGCLQRGQGGGARKDRLGPALRARRRSDRPDHPGAEPAVQGDRRHGDQGPGVRADGPGRHDFCALHDRAEKADGPEEHPEHHDLGGQRRRHR